MQAGLRGGEFRVLGPLEVSAGSGLLPLGGPRLRTVLALLVAGAGRPVSVPALVSGLWPEHAPPDADRTVRTYVSRLRKTLLPAAGADGELLVTRAPGYLLRAPADAVDAARFERLAAAGRQALAAGEPAAAARQLAEALRLWRGDAYGEFDAAALVAEAARLEQLRLAAVADRVDADLATGLGGQLVAELEALVARHAGHERFWGQLMIALYRSGRQVDAAGAFRRARDVLIEESGLQPSPALVEIHRRVLAQDTGLLVAAAGAGAPGDLGAGRPAQLPLDVPGFTGRAAELAALDAILAGAARQPTAVAVAAICGTAGAGKTGLAVHWAHRIAGQFPDGQVYVNLNGFAPGGAALSPAEALRGLLATLGVPPARLPDSLDGLTALYRSQLAGKRLLVLLDNARDTEQARPLLPGSPGCLALVTSRDDLVGLVARDGARRVALNVLAPAEALALLRSLAGDRLTDPVAAATLIEQCGRLPLALRVAADLVATRHGARLAELVGELADEGRRLDLLDAGGDTDTGIRAVFSWSERHLPPPVTRMFWLLGLHPGSDLDAPVAAALAGATPAEAGDLIDTLRRAHLIEPAGPDRWAMHDLLRAFAADRAAERISAQSRSAALTRLYDYYLTRATAAIDALFPPTGAARRPADMGFGTAAAAKAWLDAERYNLVALGQAATDELAGYAVDLARTLSTYLSVGYHNAQALAIHQRALAVAESSGDRAAQALAVFELGSAYGRAGRFAESLDHYRRALASFRALADNPGVARCLLSIASIEIRLGQYTEALAEAREALAMYQALGDRPREAAAVATIGQIRQRTGHHQDGIDHLERAGALYGATGDRVGQGRILNDLGNVLQRQGRHTEAQEYHERALRLLHEVGDRAGEACALTDLGRIYSIWQRHAEGLEHFELALALFREIGDEIGEAEALIDLGAAYQRMGRPEQAAEHHRHAHAIAAELGERALQSQALIGQGRALHARGRPAEALALHRAARALAVDLGHRDFEAQALDGMAAAHALAGRRAEADQLWTAALAILRELGLPVDGIRAQLATLAPQPG